MKRARGTAGAAAGPWRGRPAQDTRRAPRARAPGIGALLLAATLAAPMAAANAATVGPDGALELLPWPRSVERGAGSVELRPLRVVFEEHRDGRLERAAVRLLHRLAQRTGSDLDVTAALAPDAGGSEERLPLVVSCAASGSTPQALEDDESYRLRVGPDGIRIECPTVVGAIRAFVTLSQLLANGPSGWAWPEVAIEDAPRFPWRGLLIDVVRHWIPQPVLLRQLAAMEEAKLNVLHLHLTDDQAFRFASERFPALHGESADGRFFTQRDLQRLVAAAHERGIRVVPEIDVPGHTHSWLIGHPELAGRTEPLEPMPRYGVHDATLDPTRPATYEFLRQLLAEVTAVFPDRFLHIGGDEVTGRWWRESPDVTRFMDEHGLADAGDLQARFNLEMAEIVGSLDREMIGWQEILHPELPRQSVVQVWLSPEALGEALRAGHRSLLSRGFYLDHLRSAAFHYAVEPLDGLDDLTAEERDLLIGGEACMWNELVSAETLDSRLWPRAGAVAERLWSDRSLRDPALLHPRLDAFSRSLELLGLRHRSNARLMLQRIGGRHFEALSDLADAVEPVEFYSRHRSRPYTTSTPLNRLVDAVPPESDAARRFAAAVDACSESSPDACLAARIDLIRWSRQERLLLPLFRSSELAAEIRPLSGRLAQLATAGIAALDGAPPRDPAALLEEARQPHAELEIVIVDAVETLLRRSGALPPAPPPP